MVPNALGGAYHDNDRWRRRWRRANAGQGASGLGHAAIGRDAAGELYVATSENAGPTGTTGKVFKLVPPE